MTLAFSQAARRARRIGSTYRAWCDGYASALQRAPARPNRAGDFVGSLARWWLRGYRHGLGERPRFEQAELFPNMKEPQC